MTNATTLADGRYDVPMSDSLVIDWTIKAGTDFTFEIELRDGEGKLENLAGLRAIAQVRPYNDDSTLPAIELNTDNGRISVNDEEGVILFALASNTTGVLNDFETHTDGYKLGQWDSVLVDSNGNLSPLAQGKVYIEEGIIEGSTLGSAHTPVADFRWSPGNPVVNNAITFDASLSTAYTGTTISTYEWDFDNNGTFETSTSSSTTSKTFTSTGRYRVRLRVTDNTGKQSTTIGWVAVA